MLKYAALAPEFDSLNETNPELDLALQAFQARQIALCQIRVEEHEVRDWLLQLSLIHI